MSTWPLLTNDSIAGQTDILAVVKVMGAQLFEKFQPGATSASAAINEIVVDTGKVHAALHSFFSDGPKALQLLSNLLRTSWR
eukprot:8341243-Pyramimonas_sp.AAC.1